MSVENERGLLLHRVHLDKQDIKENTKKTGLDIAMLIEKNH